MYTSSGILVMVDIQQNKQVLPGAISPLSELTVISDRRTKKSAEVASHLKTRAAGAAFSQLQGVH